MPSGRFEWYRVFSRASFSAHAWALAWASPWVWRVRRLLRLRSWFMAFSTWPCWAVRQAVRRPREATRTRTARRTLVVRAVGRMGMLWASAHPADDLSDGWTAGRGPFRVVPAS